MIHSPQLFSSPKNSINLSSNLREAEDLFLRYFLTKVAPSEDSEIRRSEIFSKIKSIIETATGALVFRYGSDPLKTYLPESDVDITVIRKERLARG